VLDRTNGVAAGQRYSRNAVNHRLQISLPPADRSTALGRLKATLAAVVVVVIVLAIVVAAFILGSLIAVVIALAIAIALVVGLVRVALQRGRGRG
jgi:hypothetical protein